MRTSLEYQELESTLRRWGEWQEEHYRDSSVPRQASHLMIYADQPAGHKILCAEMDRAMWKLNYVIGKLPDRHRMILEVWYGVNIKASGGFWDASEKAARIGVRLNTLGMRVTRARRALHRKIFLTPVISGGTIMRACKIVTASRATPILEQS